MQPSFFPNCDVPFKMILLKLSSAGTGTPCSRKRDKFHFAFLETCASTNGVVVLSLFKELFVELGDKQTAGRRNNHLEIRQTTPGHMCGKLAS